MPALLALIPTKDKVYALLILGLIIFGFHLHHKILAEGIAEQKAADDKQTATLVAQTAKQTAELQAKATMAEQAYDKEHQAILDQPPLQSVRLCGNPHPRSTVVSTGSTAKQGNETAGTGTGDLQSVSQGDSGMGETAGPDISDLLSLLAQRADDYSAELREFQDR